MTFNRTDERQHGDERDYETAWPTSLSLLLIEHVETTNQGR